MASVNVQLFALPSEIIEWATDWAARFELTSVVMQFFPEYRASVVPRGAALADAMRELERSRRICLGFGRPVLDVDSPHAFLVRNPDWVVVDVGTNDEAGLRESVVNVRSDDAEVLKVCRSMVREVRKHTRTGLWCFNPTTRDKSFYESARYSERSVNEATRLVSTGGVVRCHARGVPARP